ncbi:polysaccharide pyruvyl transferase family protein [Mesorhizobium retamae]|uniref:Polysaccharide pyruvyl transferase family protein n=1 Tax=Mesorhizobium retamae TaxID=2912854 RepID=A0ABS9Q9V3_9HYPH|nr:polysaccharide pyruvyl transferase family protein [Mesorhizobium sp. IRAMC:0171]MCG7504187.1 polysaccharide pyruvyl transferase family protein [Mesorhizobium sp. IRAMC:0171]
MQPFYWESAHGNFGDDLNLWLWDFLLPGFRNVHPEVLLVGVGTVLNQALLPSDVKKLVIGSGFGYGSLPDFSNAAEWDIRAVRGPLTAEKLGLPRELGIIDPAVMVAEMPEFRNLPKTGGAIFVPHWESTVGGIWPLVCQAAGLGYVDPCGEAKSVIRAIAQAEMVVAESMHAAILADAFRVPWVAVTTSRSINSFKWSDWATSLEVEYKPRQIPISSRAEAITKGARFWGFGFEQPTVKAEDVGAQGEALVMARNDPPPSRLRSVAKQALAAPSILALWQARKAKPQLSSEARLMDRKDRFREVLAEVRRDYF